MFTLAHLSDPHLELPSNPKPTALMSKRILGYLSWTFRRSAIHKGSVLSLMMEDLHAAHPDHVVITGDITNISLPEEFARAGSWLSAQGEAGLVTVIPGNHDSYVRVPWKYSLGKWAPFMSGTDRCAEGAEVPITSNADFPFVRLRGSVALVGVSSACPTPPFSAAGRVGARQLSALSAALLGLAGRNLFRVVLIHHPPVAPPTKVRGKLLDAAAFRAEIARAGAELILHGHTHRSSLAKLATPNGHTPVISVSSASATPHRGKEHARYHLYRIERARRGWRLEVEVRGIEPTLHRFSTEGRFWMRIPG